MHGLISVPFLKLMWMAFGRQRRGQRLPFTAHDIGEHAGGDRGRYGAGVRRTGVLAQHLANR